MAGVLVGVIVLNQTLPPPRGGSYYHSYNHSKKGFYALGLEPPTTRAFYPLCQVGEEGLLKIISSAVGWQDLEDDSSSSERFVWK